MALDGALSFKLYAAHLQATRERELAHVSREVHDAHGQPLAGL
jgi:hypothetical protein